MLRGVNPVQKDKRFKAILSGEPGAGVSTAALAFPDNYILDLNDKLSIYHKTAQKMGSKIAVLSDWREVEDEIYTLASSNHPYKTLTIDTMSDYWNWIKDMWDDKFIASQIKEDLLQDFGIRYWNKIKKQYKVIRTILEDLDMNVLILAQDMPEYAFQQIIGRKPDIDNKDCHKYYFHFRFFIDEKGKFLVKTVKQNIDKSDPKFPDVFEWNYDLVTQIWGKDKIERETKYLDGNFSGETINTPNKVVSSNTIKQEPNRDKIKPILDLLKQNNIQEDDFVVFLKEKVLWNDINRLDDLTNQRIKVIIDQWTPKILPKFQETSSPISNAKEKGGKKKPTKKETEQKHEETLEQAVNERLENVPKIKPEQINRLKKSLDSYKIVEEIFFKFLNVKDWNEITEQGADNLASKIDEILGYLSSNDKQQQKGKK